MLVSVVLAACSSFVVLHPPFFVQASQMLDTDNLLLRIWLLLHQKLRLEFL